MKKNLDCFGLEIRIMEGKKVVVIDEWLMNQKDSQRILGGEFWLVN